ncbi:MAG: response regulator [Methylacidiphilales bacterium]|nr:response regulator [Candidatus Methylacidiphilales bacterium]
MAEQIKRSIPIGDVSWVSFEIITIVEDVATYLDEYFSATTQDRDGNKLKKIFNSCIPLIERAALTLEFVNAQAGSEFCNSVYSLMSSHLNDKSSTIDPNTLKTLVSKLRLIPAYLDRIIKLEYDDETAFKDKLTVAITESSNAQSQDQYWLTSLQKMLQTFISTYASENNVTNMNYKSTVKSASIKVITEITSAIKNEKLSSSDLYPALMNCAVVSKEVYCRTFYVFSAIIFKNLIKSEFPISNKVKRLIGDIGKWYVSASKITEEQFEIELLQSKIYEHCARLLRYLPDAEDISNSIVLIASQGLKPEQDIEIGKIKIILDAEYDLTLLSNFVSLLQVLESEFSTASEEQQINTINKIINTFTLPSYQWHLEYSPYIVESLQLFQQTKKISEYVLSDLRIIKSILQDVLNSKDNTKLITESENISQMSSALFTQRDEVLEIIELVKNLWLSERKETKQVYDLRLSQMIALINQIGNYVWNSEILFRTSQEYFSDLARFLESITPDQLQWSSELHNSFGELIGAYELILTQYITDEQKINDLNIFIQNSLDQFKILAATQQDEQIIQSGDEVAQLADQNVQKGFLISENKLDPESYKALAIKGGDDLQIFINDFLDEATECLPQLNNAIVSLTPKNSIDDIKAIQVVYELLIRLSSGAKIVSCDLFYEFSMLISQSLKIHLDYNIPVQLKELELLKISSQYMPQLINQIAGNGVVQNEFYTHMTRLQQAYLEVLERSNQAEGLIVDQSTDIIASAPDTQYKIDSAETSSFDVLNADSIVDNLLDITARLEQGYVFYSSPQFLTILSSVYTSLFSNEESTSPLALNYEHVINYAKARLEDGTAWNKRAILMLTMLIRSIFGFSQSPVHATTKIDDHVVSDDTSPIEVANTQHTHSTGTFIRDDDPVSISATNRDISDHILEIYIEESQDLLAQLFTMVSRISKNGIQDGDLDEFRRLLHTLKGSASMVGLSDLSNLFHVLEDVALLLIEQPSLSYRVITKDLYEIINWISVKDLQIIKGKRNDEVKYFTSSVKNIIDKYQTNNTESIPDPEVNSLIQQTQLNVPLESKIIDDTSTPQINNAPESTFDFVTNTSPLPVDDTKNSPLDGEKILLSIVLMRDLVESSSEIKVYSDLNEEVINQNNLVMREINNMLSNLTVHTEVLVTEADTNIKAKVQDHIIESKTSRVEKSQSYDPLELDEYSEIQQLSRIILEQVADIRELYSELVAAQNKLSESYQREKRVVTRVYKGLLGLYMSDAGRFIANLKYLCTQTSRVFKKKVIFKSAGEELLVDRQILKKITVAGEHLIRNSIVHGIEDEQTRIERGKDAEGTISVSFSKEGQYVKIIFKDDGNGIDIEKVRQKVKAMHLLKDNKEYTDAEILNYIYQQDVSTALKVDNYSGRGVGMNVVRDIVHELSGFIEIINTPKIGCAFVIKIPYSMNLAQLIIMKQGDLMYGLLFSFVHKTVQVNNQLLTDMYEKNKKFKHEDISYQILTLGEFVQEESGIPREEMGTLILLLPIEGQHLAIWVDSYERTIEMAIKNTGSQIASLGKYIGGTFLESGKFIFILNISVLYADHLERKRLLKLNLFVSSEVTTKGGNILIEEGSINKITILVVDDSITIRKYLERLLLREGYEVVMAKNGNEALEYLGKNIHHLPKLVITDIEMPVMDGIELLSMIRKDERLSSLPATIITSRVATKHRTEADRLNVLHFFGKPFVDSELITKIKELVT